MPPSNAIRRYVASGRGAITHSFAIFKLDALEQALHDRWLDQDGGLIHHSVSSRGDSDDNALAETINGLYKAELFHRRGPWKSIESVELVTLQWVHWFNRKCLLAPIGYLPAAEAEANDWRDIASNPVDKVA